LVTGADDIARLERERVVRTGLNISGATFGMSISRSTFDLIRSPRIQKMSR